MIRIEQKKLLGLISGCLFGLMAGCQKPAVDVVVKDQVGPEQLGLALQPVNDFVRPFEGLDRERLGESYEKDGVLAYELMRVSNPDLKPVALAAEVAGDPSQTALHLGVVTQTWFRRGSEIVFGEPPVEALPDLYHVYRSEFYVAGAEWRFSSGAKERVELNSKISKTDLDRLPRLRGGESASLIVELKLREGQGIVRSQNLPGLASGPVLYFLPPETQHDANRDLRLETMGGWEARLSSVPRLWVIDQGIDDRSEEVHSIFLSKAVEESFRAPHSYGVPNIPPRFQLRMDQVRNQHVGLPTLARRE